MKKLLTFVAAITLLLSLTSCLASPVKGNWESGGPRDYYPANASYGHVDSWWGKMSWNAAGNLEFQNGNVIYELSPENEIIGKVTLDPEILPEKYSLSWNEEYIIAERYRAEYDEFGEYFLEGGEIVLNGLLLFDRAGNFLKEITANTPEEIPDGAGVRLFDTNTLLVFRKDAIGSYNIAEEKGGLLQDFGHDGRPGSGSFFEGKYYFEVEHFEGLNEIWVTDGVTAELFYTAKGRESFEFGEDFILLQRFNGDKKELYKLPYGGEAEFLAKTDIYNDILFMGGLIGIDPGKPLIGNNKYQIIDPATGEITEIKFDFCEDAHIISFYKEGDSFSFYYSVYGNKELSYRFFDSAKAESRELLKSGFGTPFKSRSISPMGNAVAEIYESSGEYFVLCSYIKEL